MSPEGLHILSLDRLNAESVRQFGGKASNLGDLIAAGTDVPPGVAIGKDVLALFLRENGVDLAALERIHSLGMTFLESALSEARDHQARIVGIIQQAPFPAVISEALFACLGNLVEREVAVRSSCVVEDSSSTSLIIGDSHLFPSNIVAQGHPHR